VGVRVGRAGGPFVSQSNPGGLPDDVAHTDASLKSQRAAAQAGAARVVSLNPVACRSCGVLPPWHPERRACPTMRAITLRVWCGNFLRVSTVQDHVCRECAEFYGRVQGRAA